MQNPLYTEKQIVTVICRGFLRVNGVRRIHTTVPEITEKYYLKKVSGKSFRGVSEPYESIGVGSAEIHALTKFDFGTLWDRCSQ